MFFAFLFSPPPSWPQTHSFFLIFFFFFCPSSWTFFSSFDIIRRCWSNSLRWCFDCHVFVKQTHRSRVGVVCRPCDVPLKSNPELLEDFHERLMAVCLLFKSGDDCCVRECVWGCLLMVAGHAQQFHSSRSGERWRVCGFSCWLCDRYCHFLSINIEPVEPSLFCGSCWYLTEDVGEPSSRRRHASPLFFFLCWVLPHMR